MSTQQPPASPPTPNLGKIYLLGAGVTHSIAPPMHNTIAHALQKPWTFSALECPTLPAALAALHHPSVVGAVITMPYKQSIIPHLLSPSNSDGGGGLDSAATLIGAVNNIYLTPPSSSGHRSLRGTNTDHIGIRGCLHAADPSRHGHGRPALIIGAGGASRAALYTLYHEFACRLVYIANRNAEEVARLKADARAYATVLEGGQDGRQEEGLRIIHVIDRTQVGGLEKPFYVVGTVPDVAPGSAEEWEVRGVVVGFLEGEHEQKEPHGEQNGDQKEQEKGGVVLDMCFKPRNTRLLQLARKPRGGSGYWACVEGTEIIGHQMGTQWGLWTGEGEGKGKGTGESLRVRMGEEEAWRVLRREAEESRMINF